MGQSLADAAVRGNKSATDIDGEKQMLLSSGNIEGLIALERSIFGGATMMAKADDADDDADDDDDDEDDSDDDEDDSDDDDDDDDEGKTKKKVDPKDARIKEVSAEAKKYRLKAVARGKRIAELEAELAAKGKPKAKAKKDDEDSDEDDSETNEALEEEKRKTKALEERLQQQTLRTEFNDILADPKQKIKFIDPKAAFRLLDLDDVEIDEDGDVEGLEDAIKDLAKKSPYLLVKAKAKDDEDDEDDEDEDKPKRRTGQPTSRNRKSTKVANRDALVKKYGIRR